MIDSSTYEVCGIPIAAVTPAGATRTIVAAAAEGARLQVHLCNAYTLSLVRSDPVLRDALRGADLNLPDGAPVAWFGRRHGTHGPVRGAALVTDVVRAGVEHGLGHYLYGGAPGVAEDMAAALLRQIPGARIVGHESPPVGSLDSWNLDEVAARIRDSGASVVWIGLGTPKQDLAVARLGRRLRIPLVPVGAAFDFVAGRRPEAPTYLHGSGLEWLYRLVSEPRRLWRRYLVGNPRFVFDAIVTRSDRAVREVAREAA